MSEYNQISTDNPHLNNSGFFGQELSANEELDHQTLASLRKISSSMIKNNFMASTVINTLLNVIIGGPIHVKILEDKTQDDIATDLINKRLKRINSNGENLYEWLTRFLTSILEHGEILVNIIDVDGEPKVELVEASRVLTPFDRHNDKNIVEGVKYKKGREIGYYVQDDSRHNIFNYIPRFKTFNGSELEVCFLVRCPVNRRANQTRQVPFLTPGMNLMRYILDYLNTTIIQARVAATFSGFITTDVKGGLEERLQANRALVPVGKLEPGMIWQMKRGETISFASPSRPSDNTDSFLRRMSSFVSSTFRIPHEVLFLDLQNTSYLAFRGGYIEFRRVIHRFYTMLDTALEKIVKVHLLDLWLSNDVKNPDELKMLLKLPPLTVLDEEKSARANKINIDTKTVSRKHLSEELGQDWDETLVELEEEESHISEMEGKLEAVKQKAYEEACELFGIIPISQQQQEGKNRPQDPNKTAEQKKEERKTDGNW